MLELKNVFAGYAGQYALRGVSLTFRPGEVLAVVGPNGSGKSTLLRTALGLHPKSIGTILLDGLPLDAWNPKEIARRAAYLPQSRRVPDLTAERLVLHGRFPHLSYPRHSRPEDREAVREALASVDALPLADRPMKSLSGGQRQKIYLAMALVQGSATILMDEPTTYLDPAHQLQVLALARQLADQGKAVALVLHDLPLAFRTADRLAVLREGFLAAEGSPEDLYESDLLPHTFGVRLERMKLGGEWQYFYVSP